MALIVPPLPALSRPSNTRQILAPVALTHSCMATSSACSFRSSASYSFRFSLGFALSDGAGRSFVLVLTSASPHPCQPVGDRHRQEAIIGGDGAPRITRTG